MDFIEFCLSYSELQLIIKENKFYFWAIPHDTGYRLVASENALVRIDYEESPTEYQLLFTSTGFQIIKQGFLTEYELKYQGMGKLKIIRRHKRKIFFL